MDSAAGFLAGTFSPGLWFKLGLEVDPKVPLAFNPGFWLQLGLEVDPLVPVGSTNQD
jgi:hypothetical protein